MYYQILLHPKGHGASDKLRFLTQDNHEQIKVKTLDCSPDIACILERIFDTEGLQMPIVMSGLDIITQGDGAAWDLCQHMANHKHTPWEASDGEDCL